VSAETIVAGEEKTPAKLCGSLPNAAKQEIVFLYIGIFFALRFVVACLYKKNRARFSARRHHPRSSPTTMMPAFGSVRIKKQFQINPNSPRRPKPHLFSSSLSE
jgi:hypothetical protein